MPLDPSIFLTGAQLRAQQNAQTQNTINNFFDRLREDKLRQQQLELAQSRDYEGAYMKTLQAQAEGKQVDPKTSAMAQAYEKKLTAEVGQDLSGNLYQKYQPQLGGVQGVIDKMPTSPTNYIPAFGGSAPQTQSAMPPMPRATGKQIVDDLGVLPLGSNYQDVAGMPQEQRPAFRGVSIPADASPKTRQAAQEANIDLQSKSEQANLDVLKAGGEKAAQLNQENRINTEQRNKSLGEITKNIDSLLELSKGTPSGIVEGLSATVTEKLGKPNPQAIARSKFAAGKAISGLQSRIAFMKGQGTITDSEAKQAMAFLPEENDPVEIKKAKLEEAKNFIKGLMGEQTADPLTEELRRRGLIQ